MRKIAFLFPGQGAQYVGMGKELYDNFSECRNIFDESDKALEFSISNLCFKGPEEELTKTEVTQPAILTTSIGALRILENEGIQPDLVAGLSLGEYSALVCSKRLNFIDAVKLVQKRGKYMQEAVPEGIGGMAAVIGLKEEDIYDVCKEASKVGIVEPANFNCPGQIVIAGEIEALKRACEISKEKGATKAVMLNVSGPFHSSMLVKAAERLEKELNTITFSKSNIPLLTNITGDYLDEFNIKETLKKQVMSTVRWQQTINTMMKDGVTTFVEIGPGKILSAFVRKVNRKVEVYNIEDIKSLEKALIGLKK
ncbi:ACP S-malonyltransferase [Clostridium tetanomorphum]|uniref:Malonyl CoA-acyl carrier protein transacylase n=1 Tax=Clostridium tetanomorphum TaxID=1553 RepID=A0A923EAT6_CLOTT|nr:ACP S-malonyltransferase [Clostridium tetanomorphum]MBC2398407.1 ACP S-malonyltransferase [Clostridium tetanomorphum]